MEGLIPEADSGPSTKYPSRTHIVIFESERSGPDAPADPAGTLLINGKERALPQPASVRGALEVLGLASRPVAVELNGNLVRRADQESTALKPGDRVEIVSFVGGG